MKVRILPNWMVEELKSNFAYDPETGSLLRLSGQDSGICGVDRGGVLTFDHTFSTGEQVRFYVHRIAFILMTGEQPELVDHVDGDRLNNRLYNLRAATSLENNRNRGVKGSHTTISEGLMVGVTKVLRSYGTYYLARIKVGGKVLRKNFKNYGDACDQRVSWEIEHFGAFSRALSRG